MIRREARLYFLGAIHNVFHIDEAVSPVILVGHGVDIVVELANELLELVVNIRRANFIAQLREEFLDSVFAHIATLSYVYR